MFEYHGFENIRARFADQFEPVDDKFLYRLRGKAAPIRVSAAERERFIAAFERFLRLARWFLIGGTMVALLTIMALQFELGFSDDINTYATWGALAFVVAVFVVFYLRAFKAPAIELRDRPPEGGERTKEEVQRRDLQRVSWVYILLPLVLAALFVWRVGSKDALLAESNRLWLALIIFAVAASLFTLYRKWRFEISEKQ